MVRIEKTRESVSHDRTTSSAVLDLQVSTVAELPSQIGTITVMAGSIAQVIQTGGFYTLDSDGVWYDESGNAAS